jgi:hypothetical protein
MTSRIIRSRFFLAALLLVLGLPWHTTPTARSPRPRVAALVTRPAGDGWKANGAVWQGTPYDAAQGWFRDKDGIGVREWVNGYASVRLARLAYSVFGWEHLRSDVVMDPYPDDIGADMPGADHVTYTCIEHGSGACDTWWAWARYGRCTVQLEVYEDDLEHTPRPMRAYAGTITHTAEAIARRARPRC